MKEICEKLNLLASYYPSITEFARHIGFSRQTVAFWLSCKRLPTIDALKAICVKEEVPSDWLLGLNVPYDTRKTKAELQTTITYVNPVEIASHIADGTLAKWCDNIRNSIEQKIKKL